jgi:hypothetical protein
MRRYQWSHWIDVVKLVATFQLLAAAAAGPAPGELAARGGAGREVACCSAPRQHSSPCALPSYAAPRTPPPRATDGHSLPLRSSNAAGCASQPGGLQGPILVLSASSMEPSFPGATAPDAATPAACCAACQRTDGCAGWSLCAAAGGCGAPGECAAHVAAQPPRAPGPDRYPVTRFGYNGNVVSACAAGGRWPKGQCMLRGGAVALATPKGVPRFARQAGGAPAARQHLLSGA